MNVPLLYAIAEKILFWGAVCLIMLDFYYVIFHKGIPNIRTAPAIRKKIIELLRQDFQSRGKRTYTIIDLGSGNGLFTREIAKALPEASVIGLEVNPQSVFWANWLKDKEKIPNLTYRKVDFMTYDFAEADAVVMYLIPTVMGVLGKKLRADVRRGTLITSNKFPLGDNWQAEEILQVKTLYPHQGKLHVYRAK